MSSSGVGEDYLFGVVCCSRLFSGVFLFWSLFYYAFFEFEEEAFFDLDFLVLGDRTWVFFSSSVANHGVIVALILGLTDDFVPDCFTWGCFFMRESSRGVLVVGSALVVTLEVTLVGFIVLVTF